MHFKRWRFLAVLAVLALVAAACGDDDEAADISGQSLEVFAVWADDSAEGTNFAMVIAQFEADTGVDVTYTGVATDASTVLSTRVEGGDPPDVAFLPQPGLMVDLVARGALVDINGAVGSIVNDNYARVWRDLGTVDGTLYGVWFKGANKSTVWYDVAAFDAAGVEPPSTWDEWIAVSQALVDAGAGAISVGGADGWTLSDWFENAYIRVAGSDNYDALFTGELSWEDQTVKDTLEFLGQILTEDFMNGGSANALQTGFVDSVTDVYTAGDAAVVYEGDFVAGVIAGETTAVAGTGFDFFDFPSIDGSGPSVIGGGDVAVTFTGTEAAMAFLRYLAGPESAEIWAAQGGFSSMNRKVDSSVYPDAITRRAAEALANADAFRFDGSDLVPAALGATGGAGIWGGLQEWLGNQGDVDAILAQIQQEAEAAFAG
ncbi:MAG: extracellular solute-binding protein [Acidobacteria bacterium]|nr:extracellular solute-binding protein [Acidobacteriota bacterium]